MEPNIGPSHFWLAVPSPTRFVFDRMNRHTRIGISGWSWLFLGIAVALLFASPWLGFREWPKCFLVALLWLLPLSRIFELTYAFYNDSFDRLGGIRPRTKIGRRERIELLARSYVEIAIQFAIIFVSLPAQSVEKRLLSPLDAFYLSWMTITTTGYGDFTPQTGIARMLCMCEVGIGLMLIVFAVGAYFSFSDSTQ